MRLEELMVGDLVYSSFSDIPCKVQYLELRESGYGSVKTSNVDGIKDIASLYPIPLTPEILEKNGFEETKNYYPYPTYEYHIKDKDKKFVVRVAFPNCSKATKRTKPFIEIDAEWCWYNNDCEFVHQLQNALKLCGIDKTIEL